MKIKSNIITSLFSRNKKRNVTTGSSFQKDTQAQVYALVSFLQGSLRQEEREKRMMKENINQIMNHTFYIFPIFKA